MLKPSINEVLNKIDKASESQLNEIKDNLHYEKIIEISATEGLNLDVLLELIEENLPYSMNKFEVLVPYDRGDIVSMIHRSSRVIEEEYRDEGTFLLVEAKDEIYNKSKDFLLKKIN